MKKVISILMATVITLASLSIPVMAAPGKNNGNRPNKPGNNKQEAVQEDIGFYISRWGTQHDEQGNIESRDVDHFSSIVAEAKLNEELDDDFAIALGEDVTEEDIIAYVSEIPDEEDVFEALIDEYKDAGAKLYTDDGEIVLWDDFTTDNYDVKWYVLKKEWDHWHIDGVIIDKETGEDINIVEPDEEVEFEEEVVEPTPAPAEEVEEPSPTEEPEPVPTEEPTPAPTEEPQEIEEDESIILDGVQYAYIFGYEPLIKQTVNENGETVMTAEIRMAMDDYVTVDQVSSMLMRLLDQTGKTQDVTYPMVPAAQPHAGQWYERGLLYLCSVGGFDTDKIITLGPITRGQVAKLVACALRLNLTAQTPFEDIADSEYKEYIEKVYRYNYMKGHSATEFAPDDVMTRAEFCKLFNNIIGRDAKGLTALSEDGILFRVSAEDYYFVDMDPSHWAYETCLKATSAYDENGFVDIVSRNANIRNKLDQYDAQKYY